MKVYRVKCRKAPRLFFVCALVILTYLAPIRAIFADDNQLHLTNERRCSQIFVDLISSGWKGPVKSKGIPEIWTFDGLDFGQEYYVKDFAKAFNQTDVKSHEKFFKDFLKTRKKEKKHTHVLDLMGSGFFLENSKNTDSITGLRLNPFDKSFLPENYNHNDMPEQILGDIFDAKTWEKLDMSARNRGILSFDLIVLRPHGGWENQSFSDKHGKSLLSLNYVIRKTIERLSPDGRFYFSIPWTLRLSPEKPDFTYYLGDLTSDIERHTPFRLILDTDVNNAGYRDRVVGAVVPR